MSEKIGLLAAIMIFAIFILPFGLNYHIETVKASKLMAVSNEFNQLMVAEGDITSRVRHVVNDFKQKGITIEFKDETGALISSRQDIGQKITTTISFDGYEITNSAVLSKR